MLSLKGRNWAAMELKKSSPLGLGWNGLNFEFTVVDVRREGWLNSISFDRDDPSPYKDYWVNTFPSKGWEGWDTTLDGDGYTIPGLVELGASWIIEPIFEHDEALRKGEDVALVLTALLFVTMNASLLRGCSRKPGAGADHLDVARVLLQHGADPARIMPNPEFRGGEFGSPLCYARSRGDFEAFRYLFEAHPRVMRKLARRRCSNCQGEGSILAPAFQRCAGCERCQFCSKECQKMHWRREHRNFCPGRAKQIKKKQKARLEADLARVRSQIMSSDLERSRVKKELMMTIANNLMNDAPVEHFIQLPDGGLLPVSFSASDIRMAAEFHGRKFPE